MKNETFRAAIWQKLNDFFRKELILKLKLCEYLNKLKANQYPWGPQQVLKVNMKLYSAN